MKTFTVNIYSSKPHNGGIISGLLIGLMALLIAVYCRFPLTGVGAFIVFFGSGIFVGKKIHKGKAMISINEDGFKIEWIKNFGILKKDNVALRFSDLTEYVIEGFGHFYFLKFKTISGKKEKLEFDLSNQDGENLGLFLDEFENKILGYNKRVDASNRIKIGKNMWQSLSSKIMAVVLVFLIIYYSIEVLNKSLDYSKVIGLIFLMVATIFYIKKVIKENRKIKDEI